MENELKHYGVIGMKWGIRRTPEQLGHRPKAVMQKVAGKIVKQEAGSAIKKKANAAVDKAKSAGKKAESEKTPEERKQEVLKTRSAKALYDNADLFTDDELRSAYNRLQLEKNISGLAPKEVSKGQEYADKMIKAGKTFNDIADTGIKVYNNVAKIYNTFSTEGKKNPWPLIKNDDKGDKSNNDDSGDNKSNNKQNNQSNNSSDDAKKSKAAEAASNAANKAKEAAGKAADKAKESAKEAAKDAASKTKDWYENQQARQNVQDAPKTKTTSSSSKKSTSDIIDMEWNESTGSFQMAGKSHTTSLATRGVTSVATTSNVSSGQNYVAGLLEEPKK